MELTQQESNLLQRFVARMEQAASADNEDRSSDQGLIMVYKEFINNEHYAGMIDTLTSLAVFFIDNASLLPVIIINLSVSDRIVEHLFFDTIDEVDREKRSTIIMLLSVHRYMLFENIANKTAILQELSEFIDERMREPGMA